MRRLQTERMVSAHRSVSIGPTACSARSSRSVLAASAVFAALLLTPALACADEPVRVYRRDPDAVPPPGTRMPLLITGGVLFAGSYGLALGASALWPGAPMAAELQLPVVGPFMALAEAPCQASETGCTTFTEVFRGIGISLDAILQVGALALMIESALLPEGPRAPAPLARTERGATSFFHFAPYFTSGGGGLRVLSTF